MTNGDYIRSLNDDELAKFLGAIVFKNPNWRANFPLCDKCEGDYYFLMGASDGRHMELRPCEAGKGCPHGMFTLLWLKQYAPDTTERNTAWK